MATFEFYYQSARIAVTSDGWGHHAWILFAAISNAAAFAKAFPLRRSSRCSRLISSGLGRGASPVVQAEQRLLVAILGHLPLEHSTCTE